MCSGAPDDNTLCNECWTRRLDEAMSSGTGSAISEAIALDFQCRNHIAASPDEINIYEFAILQVLHQERSKWESEQIKNSEGN